MKRKNILKKSSRSVLSISMCIIILFGTFIIGGSANASTSNYSHSAAVDYAKKHWNDGVGLCAQFVAACITAGGISVSDKVCYNLYNSLKPYGTVYKLKTYGSGKNTRIRINKRQLVMMRINPCPISRRLFPSPAVCVDL